MKNYLIEQLDDLAGTPCPCGTSRRAFCIPENPIASIHLVEGQIELDGEVISVKPMTAILIKPGCRHRAIGEMKIINIPVPTFDPADEHFDDNPE